MLGASQGTNEGDSQCDPHPEAIVSQSENTRNAYPYDESDIYLYLNLTKIFQRTQHTMI